MRREEAHMYLQCGEGEFGLQSEGKKAKGAELNHKTAKPQPLSSGKFPSWQYETKL